MQGKRVFITGGSSGIGLARALANRGSHVMIASRSRDKLSCARSTIGAPCEAAVLDITDEAALKTFFDEVEAFDHLITVAAGTAYGPFPDLDTRAARDLVESKLWSQCQYNTAKFAVSKLKLDASEQAAGAKTP